MSASLPNWTVVERQLAALPQRAMAAFAVRAARRVASRIAAGQDKYGVEAWEWFGAVDDALQAVAAFAAGQPVSRFTLDVAAELARAAATATAAAARRVGPSPNVEQLELAYAAAAFAADCARAVTSPRAAAMAVQAARAAEAALPETWKLMDFDLRMLTGQETVDPSDSGPLGELWPTGEPDWSREGWEALQKVRAKLTAFIVLPPSASTHLDGSGP